MGLSNDLISQFVKGVNGDKKKAEETTVYGTAVEYEGKMYARLDGSDRLTPINTTTSVEDGERVVITIKNHSATVTGNMSSPSARIDTVNEIGGKVAAFDTVIAGKVSAKELEAEVARIQKLEAEDVRINGVLTANEADINLLKANDVEISGKLTATEATIDNLKTTKLDAASADIKYATIANLNATDANVHTLDASYGKINSLIFGSATGDVIQTNFSNAVIAQLGDAQIKSAMISEVAAGKITAGDIITDNVRVKSEDGNLLISDNTIQISDDARVRVQIGKDASGDYSINIWDAEGKLMFSEGGITDDAIKEAIIRNDMVSDDANIDAAKLNISSLFREINDGTETIKSTKVYLDDKNQTLDISFKEMSDTVTDMGETLTSQGTDLSVIQGQINSKIWQQDIDALQIGGRNLLLGSDVEYNNNEYCIARYTPTITLVAGETYTVSMCVTPATGVEYFAMYLSNGSALNAALYTDGTTNKQIVTKTFVCKYNDEHLPEADQENVVCKFYRFPSGGAVTSNSIIHWVKVEKGSKATDWSPAPEEMATGAQLSTKYSELEQTLEGFKTTVSETYVTNDYMEYVEGVVSEHTSRLDIVPTKAEAVSLVEQKAGSITSTVKAYVEEIAGGENLILDSELIKASNKWSHSDMTVDFKDGYLKMTKGATSARAFYNHQNGVELPIAGHAYTVSLEVKKLPGVNIPPDSNAFIRYINNGTILGELSAPIPTDIPENSWTKITATATYNFTEPTHVQTTIALGTTAGGVACRRFKYEKGSKATDWSPAPEDVEARIAIAESTIEQLPNKITLAVNAVEIGGRNLLLGSKPEVEITNNNYNTNTYTPSSPLVDGETYTVSMCVTPARNVTSWLLYLSSGYSNNAELRVSGTTKQIVTATFVCKYHDNRTPEDNAAYARCQFYRFPNDGTVTDNSTIHWVKIEKGHKATDWTPAPEEMATGAQLSVTKSGLEGKITTASQTATNYLNFGTAGLVVGNHAASTLGENVLIANNAVKIRNGSTENATFAEDLIELGKNSDSATISMLNDRFKIYYESDLDEGGLGVYGKTPDNTMRLAFQPVNENGNLTLGWGGYQEKVNQTNIYGNIVWLKAADKIILSPDSSWTESRGNITMSNGRSLYGKNTSGADRSMVQMNVSNQMVFGYGSRINNEGASYYDGNTVYIRSNNGVYIDGRKFGSQKVLWSGAYYMTEDHKPKLNEAVSSQPNGIVLVFSNYEGGAKDESFHHFYVSKAFVASHEGKGSSFPMADVGDFSHVGGKYLYIYDTEIWGHANNALEGTLGEYQSLRNSRFVLRYVYGV